MLELLYQNANLTYVSSLLVSIIITNLNGVRWLPGLFKSIKEQTYKNIEIIFVDGGSKDASIKSAQKYLKKFNKQKLIIEKRPGWSLANNVGAEKAHGKVLFFLSNDMEVEKNCIEEIVNFLNRYPGIAIVQCHSISLDDKKTLDSGMNFIDRFGFLYGYQPTTKPAKTFFSEGMAFAARKKVYAKTKLDNDFIMEYDDVDLSWKVRLLGYDLAFLPLAKVFHGRGGTVGKNYFQRNLRNTIQYTHNHLVSLTRYLEMKNLIVSIPFVLGIRIIAIFYFLFKRKPTLAQATLQGIIWYLKDLPKTLKERKIFQAKRKVNDNYLKQYWVSFKPLFILSWVNAQKSSKRPVLPSSNLPKEIFLI